MADEIDEDLFQRAAALQRSGCYAEAVEVYQRLAARVLTLKVAVNLGICLGEIGERAGAEHYLGLAAGHRPDDPAVRRLLGHAYAASGRIGEAEAEYRAALAAQPGDPNSELALGGLYLSAGRYAEGWPLMAARITLNPDVVPAINVPYPEWRGEPLAGKSILVWLEQGFGDQIQFARFANSLKALGAARVTLGCRPVLKDLFATIAGVDDLVAVSVGAKGAVRTHDYWSRYFSLPAALGLTLETVPAEPYLSAPSDRLARWSGKGGGARVGLVWKASPTGFNAANKGLPDELAQRLLDLGAVSLHPEDTGAQDFADTAAIVEGLDLVVSIDTSVAHLAGAMGKRCWTLLPYVRSDWRWLHERADSPWYPTMRLYRQDRPRDWTPTVDRVIADLTAAGLA